MSSKGPKPLFLTKNDISNFYGVDNRKATQIVKDLDSCGVHTGNLLYSRRDVEAKLKESK